MTRRPSADLPPQRAKVLAFIQAEVARIGRFPSNTAIADRMGWQGTGAVNDVLHTLVIEGHLKRAGRHTTGTKRIIWELVP